MHKHLRRIPVWLAPQTAVIYFVTCGTTSRKTLLANPLAHAAMRAAWQRLADWRVGRYVIMPDHVHFFIAPLVREANLSRCVQAFRSFTTKSLHPEGYPYPLWQREFFDHLLRSNESYQDKWNYVLWNPVRHGLVADPSKWPYAGEIYTLEG